MQQRVAKIFGWIFILVGVLGLFGFAGGTMSMSPSSDLLGLFPVNLLHNLVHVLIGVWGLNAARTSAGATSYCKLAGALYIVLAIIGFVPSLVDSLAGIVPLGGNDRFLHLVFGAILVYAGISGPAERAAA